MEADDSFHGSMGGILQHRAKVTANSTYCCGGRTWQALFQQDAIASVGADHDMVSIHSDTDVAEPIVHDPFILRLQSDYIWDPERAQVEEGMLLDHMSLPPMYRSSLRTLKQSCWTPESGCLTVPPDGLMAFV